MCDWPLSSTLMSPAHCTLHLECFARDFDHHRAPDTRPRSVGVQRLGCALLCGKGVVWQRSRRSVCQMTPSLPWPPCMLNSGRIESVTSSLVGMMEEVLSDPVWDLIGPRLAPGDVVKLRTASRCWNVGDKYGLCGEVFQHVENGPVREAHWHHDPRDKREFTKFWTVSVNLGFILRWKMSHRNREICPLWGVC